jgi:hypothetical protein
MREYSSIDVQAASAFYPLKAMFHRSFAYGWTLVKTATRITGNPDMLLAPKRDVHFSSFLFSD